INLTIFIADSAVTGKKVHYGIKVEGINLGQKTSSGAEKALQLEINKILKKPLNIVYEGQSWSVKAEDYGLTIQYDETVKECLQVGRFGNLWSRYVERISLWFKKKEVSLSYLIEKEKIEKWAESISDGINKEPVNATLKIVNNEILLVPSQLGLKIDVETLAEIFPEKLISSKNRTFELPVSILPAEVTEEGAKAAIFNTKKIISSSVVLKYDRYEWELIPEDLGKMIEFEGSPNLKPVLIKEKVFKLISEIGKDFKVEPKDARFTVDGKNVYIVASKDGEEIDAEHAYRELSIKILENEPREIALKTKLISPELSSEEARAMNIKTRISYFKTTYKSSQTSRVHNIHLLADTLNNMIIAPGVKFSFNERVGDRTADKGYKKAPTIVDGELVDTFGGGVCQVGTTFFNTVFFAGLPIKERHNHSYYISSYPKGRDATVSYGSLDLKFVNNTEGHILIKCFYTNSSLTIALYGTDPGYEVSYTTSDFTNIKPFEQEIEENPELDEGVVNIIQKGIEG
ncbi:MAG: VanW family protein, partial [Actinomycetia bacterium]|nr:VanW family protein [Actinomycetes bacterium]